MVIPGAVEIAFTVIVFENVLMHSPAAVARAFTISFGKTFTLVDQLPPVTVGLAERMALTNKWIVVPFASELVPLTKTPVPAHKVVEVITGSSVCCLTNTGFDKLLGHLPTTEIST